jgi:hypothetical protein
MPSIAIDIALLVALVFTCGFSFAMLREFRRFKANAGEYGSALHEAAQAMGRVDEALARTHDEGARTAITLGERLDAAQRTLDELKATEATASAQLLRLRERIHEARDAASRAETAIREANEPGEGSGARKGSRRGGAKAEARKSEAVKGDDHPVGRKVLAGKALSSKVVSGKSGSEMPVAEVVADAVASLSGDDGQPEQSSGRLALAPAEKVAQDAPRTRKIVSWPVIRSARLAAGS